MAYGLQIWNSLGESTLTVADSLTKYVGSVTIPNNSTNGSRVFADLAGGRPFASVLRTTTNPGLWIVPNVTFSGTTVFWTFPSGGGGTSGRGACLIVIGVY